MVGPCPACGKGENRFGVRAGDGLFSKRPGGGTQTKLPNSDAGRRKPRKRKAVDDPPCDCSPKDIFKACRDAGWDPGSRQEKRSRDELEAAAKGLRKPIPDILKKPVILAEGVIPTTLDTHRDEGGSVESWLFRAVDGTELRALRRNYADGGKFNWRNPKDVEEFVLPICTEWPLNLKKPIIIVEGERTLQAIKDAGLQGITFIGGSSHSKLAPKMVDGFLKAVGEPAGNLLFVIWPDNDASGIIFMQSVRSSLGEAEALICCVNPAQFEFANFDAADCGSPEEIIQIVKKAEAWHPNDERKKMKDEQEENAGSLTDKAQRWKQSQKPTEESANASFAPDLSPPSRPMPEGNIQIKRFSESYEAFEETLHKIDVEVRKNVRNRRIEYDIGDGFGQSANKEASDLIRDCIITIFHDKVRLLREYKTPKGPENRPVPWKIKKIDFDRLVRTSINMRRETRIVDGFHADFLSKAPKWDGTPRREKLLDQFFKRIGGLRISDLGKPVSLRRSGMAHFDERRKARRTADPDRRGRNREIKPAESNLSIQIPAGILLRRARSEPEEQGDYRGYHRKGRRREFRGGRSERRQPCEAQRPAVASGGKQAAGIS